MKNKILLILSLLFIGLSYAQNYPIYYAKKTVYIYQNPDLESAIKGEVPKGEKVKVLKSSGYAASEGFWEISYKGLYGYAKKDELSYKQVLSGSDSDDYQKKPSQTYTSNKKVGFNPFLGQTTASVNFRTSPTTNSSVIKTLSGGVQIYVYSKETINDFYKVIDIESSKVGWVHKNFVRYVEKLDVNSQGAFQSMGYSSSYNSDVSIRNKSSYHIKLIIDDKEYSLNPNSTKSIKVKPGKKYYIATAPGVIPSSGYQSFESNNAYEWQFWVSTSRY